jgi:hypothetical protein
MNEEIEELKFRNETESFIYKILNRYSYRPVIVQNFLYHLDINSFIISAKNFNWTELIFFLMKKHTICTNILSLICFQSI